MPDSTPSFSMFHRRLALLFVAVVLASVALIGQLGRLTLAQGAELRKDAEAKLVNREWVETIRGRILDRKGRVLAQDRPSFNVSVDFRVISGDWARRRAGVAAKKYNINEWGKLSSEERQALIDTYVPIYQEHVDRMWDKFASTAGMPRQELEEKKSQILKRVGSMKTSIYAQRLGKELNARLARGEEISPDLEDETIKRLNRPIADQRSPQVVLPNATDDAAFEFMRLAGEKVELSVPVGDGKFEAESQPRMPGMTVSPSGEREYPMDSLRVEVDLSTLPPVPGLLREGKKLITVDGVAYHVLGSMKESAQKEDSDRRRAMLKGDAAFASRVNTPADMPGLITPLDRGEYQDDDAAGKSGIEASREEALRGLRGLNVEQLDTGEERKLAPERGKDVQLTLDISLQARVQAAMSSELGLAVAQEWHGHENPTMPLGTPLNGAAVVLEVDSGEVLAMVSTPSVSRSRLLEDPDSIFESPLNKAVDVPWLDRAIARPYPPGSIAKAMILNGAVKLGKHSLDSHIDCNGHLFPDKPNMFRCWIYKMTKGASTHTATFGHALSAPEALMVSCNIYFFTLGQKLGPADITNTYEMFGLGQRWNLGVGVEYEGEIGERLSGGGKAPLAIQDAIQMGIGQGPVAWTPLHAADAYATLARGGTRLHPHVVNEAGARESEDIGLDRRAVKEAMQGLWNSINEDQGSGNHLTIDGRHVSHFNAPGVAIWGKTGTATAPTVRVKPMTKDPKSGLDVPNPLWESGIEAGVIIEASKDPTFTLPPETRALRWGDHSWFVVLVGTKAENRPRYAVAVMMEYAGSGGKVSGPIVNQIIHALIAEGYLS